MKKLILLILFLTAGLTWGQENIIPTRNAVSGFVPPWTDEYISGTDYLKVLLSTSTTTTPAMNFDNYTGEKLNFKARTFGGSNETENTVYIDVSTNNGTSWTEVTSRTPTDDKFKAMTEVDLSSYSGTQVKVKLYVKGTKDGVGAGIDDITFTGVLSGDPAPVLTADNTANTVDNNIDISFTDNADWRSKITAVKIGGTALTANDYEISAGNIMLKPSIGNSLLRTAGSKTVTVEASGYITASVTQIINAGVPTANSTATITSALVTGSSRTVTCTAKDQYNNSVIDYNFKMDISITNSDLTKTESYKVDGTEYTSSENNKSLVSKTTADGVAKFTIEIPATVDISDGVSVQVKLADGTTTIGSAFEYFKQAPQITLTTSDPGIITALQPNTTNNPIYKIKVTTVNDAVQLTNLVALFEGNYTASDIVTNGFKLYYSSDATFSSSSDTKIGEVSSESEGEGDIIEFSAISRTLPLGDSYLFLTVDLTASAVVDHTINGSITANSDLTFTGSYTFGTSNISAGSSYSIISGPSVLTPGDIAIIAFQSDDPDQFSFISFVDLNPSTSINFTDNSWNNSSLVTSEGIITWTSPSTILQKGTVITINGTTNSVNLGSLSSSGSFLLSSSGDQLLVYQGENNSPSFIFGYSESDWLTSGSPTSKTSYLPQTLVLGESAISFTSSFENKYYKYKKNSGSITAIKTKIFNENNWIGSQDVFGLSELPSWEFNIIDGNLNASSNNSVGTGNVQVPITGNTGVGHIHFTNVTTGGAINVDRYADAPNGNSGVVGNVSHYRWIIEPDDQVVFNQTSGYSLRFEIVNCPGIAELEEGNNTKVKLYKRSNPGHGTFDDCGFLTYHRAGTAGNQTDDYLTSGSITTGFSEFVFGSSESPLPVELSSFTATIVKNGVVLNWATASEINNNRFEIERKIAENNWENIGSVNGHGNSNSVKEYTYTDNNLSTAGTYSYRLKQVDNDGQFTYSSIVEVNVEAPKEFGLVQNYPNPFNPETTISYSIPQSCAVKLIVFNALGQEVMTLVNGYFEAGNHSVKFNASNLPSGVYFYQMQAGNFTSVKKMILTK